MAWVSQWLGELFIKTRDGKGRGGMVKKGEYEF